MTDTADTLKKEIGELLNKMYEVMCLVQSRVVSEVKGPSVAKLICAQLPKEVIIPSPKELLKGLMTSLVSETLRGGPHILLGETQYFKELIQNDGDFLIVFNALLNVVEFEGSVILDEIEEAEKREV